MNIACGFVLIVLGLINIVQYLFEVFRVGFFWNVYGVIVLAPYFIWKVCIWASSSDDLRRRCDASDDEKKEHRRLCFVTFSALLLVIGAAFVVFDRFCLMSELVSNLCIFISGLFFIASGFGILHDHLIRFRQRLNQKSWF